MRLRCERSILESSLHIMKREKAKSPVHNSVWIEHSIQKIRTIYTCPIILFLERCYHINQFSLEPLAKHGLSSSFPATPIMA